MLRRPRDVLTAAQWLHLYSLGCNFISSAQTLCIGDPAPLFPLFIHITHTEPELGPSEKINHYLYSQLGFYLCSLSFLTKWSSHQSFSLDRVPSKVNIAIFESLTIFYILHFTQTQCASSPASIYLLTSIYLWPGIANNARVRRILTIARNNMKSLFYCCDDVIMIEDGRPAWRVGLQSTVIAIFCDQGLSGKNIVTLS